MSFCLHHPALVRGVTPLPRRAAIIGTGPVPVLACRTSCVTRKYRSKRGDLVAAVEALSTEVVETSKNGTVAKSHPISLDSENGNGNGVATPDVILYSADGSSSSNGVSISNGVYTSNGNGVSYANDTSSSNGNGVAYANGASSSNGNGVYTNGTRAASSNGVAAAAVKVTVPESSNGVHKATAQIPTATSTSTATKNDSTASPQPTPDTPKTAAGTPYKNPGGRWNQFKTYSVFQRTFEIWTFALQFACKYFLLGQKWTYGKEGMTTATISARKTELAIWLREGLVKLGPTFIKIGQQFSTRVDVLSPEFVKELEKLQDNVPPFDIESAVRIIERNLGKPVNQIFDKFNPTPIAAASLGQVHLAELNGKQVVVKVQRPGLKELFDIDLKNIRALAVWLQSVDPKTDGAARDWVAIYDECSRILYEEIDYKLEAKNADKFRANFKDVPWIKVPDVYWEYTTSEVLVLEYVPGTKINNAEAIDKMGLDRKRLARLSVESYLQQLLRHGFFHADPHPGNVAVDAVDGGRLIYYDFGMMGSIPGDIRGGLSELFYGVFNQDPDRCLSALIKMGVLIPGKDQTAVRRTAEFFLSSFQERLSDQKQERDAKGNSYNESFKPQRTKEEAKARRKKILASIGEDLLLCAADQPFRFPATFTFVARSFTVLDGIGKSLDPRFDISEISAPYARELLLEAKPQFAKWAAELKKRSDNQNRAVINLFKAPNAIDYVASTMGKLERGDIKLRVRALEAERALVRVQELQRVLLAMLAATTLVNVGTVLSVSALSTAATASFTGAGLVGVLALAKYLKVVSLENKEKQITGTA